MKIKQTSQKERALFIPNHKNLIKIVEGLKASGFKIVLTTGSFDLSHPGHKLYTEKAKGLGNILIVGIDTDKLIRQDKKGKPGPLRPIMPQEERALDAQFWRPIDIVTFNHKHKGLGSLIRLVKPDVLVISETTMDKKKFLKGMQRVHGKYCGIIKMLPPQATTSSSAIIRKVIVGGNEDLKRKIFELIENHMYKPSTKKS